MRAIQVVAAVVRRADQVLVAQRASGKRHEGCWEFPGGKVREGEDFKAATQRELLEELGVQVTWVGEPIYKARDPGSQFVINFVPVTITGSPLPLEHAQLRWVPVDALQTLTLAPADTSFSHHLTQPNAQLRAESDV